MQQFPCHLVPVPAATMPVLLTVKEAADLFRLHPKTVARLCGVGLIRGAFKVGGVWRIPAPAAQPGFLRVEDARAAA